MGSLGLGDLYPDIAGTITALTASMWDCSAIVFELFALAYRVVPAGEKHQHSRRLTHGARRRASTHGARANT
jgi:hypothetical protein